MEVRWHVKINRTSGLLLAPSVLGLVYVIMASLHVSQRTSTGSIKPSVDIRDRDSLKLRRRMCDSVLLQTTFMIQWRSQKFFTGVRSSNCFQSSTDAIRCFCRQRNFERRTRHHLPHFLIGNLTEVMEMHHGEHYNGGSRTQSFSLLDEELSKFVGVDAS